MNLEYFSRSAKQVIAKATDLANQLYNRHLDPEHVFLSLLQLPEVNSAKIVLENLGVNVSRLVYRLENHLYHNQGDIKQQCTFSPRTIALFESAYKEMRFFKNKEIGTAHILIALSLENSYPIQQIIRENQLDTNKLRKGFASYLNELKREERQSRKTQTPNLDRFSKDLTKLAAEKQLDPVIGRIQEIERLIHILAKRVKNNPVLVGEPGVGKTAIVEGLAQRIMDKRVPRILQDKRVLAIDMAGLVAGTKFRGEFEERLKNIIDEIHKSQSRIIIFIDELHTILGAGSAEGSLDASNILKPSLASGKLRCIGATTYREFRRYIEKDGALSRRFQPIMVEEPSFNDTLEILLGLKDEYEKYHRVKITYPALERAIYLSNRFITDRKLPDKAIDVIDEAAAWVNILHSKDVEEEGVPKRLSPRESAEVILSEDDKERVGELEEAPGEAAREFEAFEPEEPTEFAVVDERDVARVVEQWTGIPMSSFTEDETKMLADMEQVLKGEIIGQEHVIDLVSKAIKRSYSGVKERNRPIGSFIFVGPTGVGKTELAKVLAKTVFLDEKALVKIDMSEYGERFTTSRLIGSPPGYVGFEEGGQLTEAVRRHPYSVVLFDEIEKAHPEVFNLLLQLLDDGVLTDSQGRKIYFNNCIVIMTTNIGGKLLSDAEMIGFRKAFEEERDLAAIYEQYKKKSETHIKKYLKPEFLNRLDELLYFNPLDKHAIREVSALHIRKMADKLKEVGYTLLFTEKIVDKISDEGYSLEYGARNIKRTVQKLLEDPISEKILGKEYAKGDTIYASIPADAIVISKELTEDNQLSASSIGPTPSEVPLEESHTYS